MKYKVYWSLWSIIFICLVVAGCNDMSATESVSIPLFETETSPPLISPSPLPSATKPITPTQASTSTATPTPQPTSTPDLTATLLASCPNREKTIPSNISLNGSIIFSETDVNAPYDMWDHFSLLTLPDSSIHPFLDELSQGIGSFYLSPDSQWLALAYEYLDGQGNWSDDLMFISTRDFEERRIFPRNKADWSYSYLGWLADSKRFLIIPSEESRDGREDDVIIFDTFTGDQQKITNAFPDPGYIRDLYLRNYGRTAIYDPTFTRVVYYEGDFSPNTMVLWNIETDKELWRFAEDEAMAVASTAWSPDGQKFAFIEIEGSVINADDFRITIVNREGEIITQSNTVPGYPKLQKYLQWSPDGRYLIFSLQHIEGERRAEKFIFDTLTNQILDFCLTDVSGTIWAPNSQQLIVQLEVSPIRGTPEAQRPLQTFLVDIELNQVFQLSSIPIGTIDALLWFDPEK